MKRILVVNPYGIGDVLFCTPLLQTLKNQPGVERVDVLLGVSHQGNIGTQSQCR